MLEDSLIYYDIGAIDIYGPTLDPEARGALESPFRIVDNWKYIKKFYGFDPNFKEEYKVDGKKHLYNYAILDKDFEEKTYYMCLRKVNNTLRIPGEKFYVSRFVERDASPRTRKKIICRKLENIIKQKEGDIDILKIDAHGSEHEIIVGCGAYLKDIIIMEVEMWSARSYKGALGAIGLSKYLLDKLFIPCKIMDRDYRTNQWANILWLNMREHKIDKLKLIKKIYKLDDLHILTWKNNYDKISKEMFMEKPK